MIDPNTKLEDGGRVKISGLWHAVEISSIPGKLCCKIGDDRHFGLIKKPNNLVGAENSFYAPRT